MRLQYFADTDTLSIRLRDAPTAETRELNEDVTIDVAADGSILAIDFEHASRTLDMSSIEIAPLPMVVPQTQAEALAA